jgi:hypothetical protein
MDIYCVYLTIYSGNLLPPFYIGFSKLENIAKGYHGSVVSKRYRDIWEKELIKHPEHFKSIILTTHPTRRAANERESSFQKSLNAARNPLYTNRAHGARFFNTKGYKMSEETRKVYRKPKSADHRANISKGRMGIKFSKKQIEKIREAVRHQVHTDESRRKRRQIMSQLKWWNNGSICKRAQQPPDDTWQTGRIKWKKPKTSNYLTPSFLQYLPKN